MGRLPTHSNGGGDVRSGDLFTTAVLHLHDKLTLEEVSGRIGGPKRDQEERRHDDELDRPGAQPLQPARVTHNAILP